MTDKFIGIVAGVLLAVYIVTTYISAPSNSAKSEATRIGGNMVTQMQTVDK